MSQVSLIRELIEEGKSDAEIEAILDDLQCEANDARRAEEDDAGWTPTDEASMTWRDTPRFNDAGEYMI